MNMALWIAQGLLALIFLFAGGAKLVMPIEEMTKQMPVALPGLFLRFIAVCEVLGALGLILPGLLRIRPGLTPLAAAGLVIIMIGATVITLMTGDIVMALFPLVVGLLAAQAVIWLREMHRYRDYIIPPSDESLLRSPLNLPGLLFRALSERQHLAADLTESATFLLNAPAASGIGDLDRR